MKVRRILPDLAMATKGGVNMFALLAEAETILIDCGTAEIGPDLVESIRSFKPVSGIVITHAHFDHAGGAQAVANATGAPIWMHRQDAELLGRGEWLRPADHAGTPLSWLLNRQIVQKGPNHIPKLKVDHVLTDGGHIDLAGGLTVHGMPGHSAGQIALTWTSASGVKVLFAADTCMNVLGLTQPIIYESKTEGLASIGKLTALAKTADLMVFGHGNPLKSPALKMERFARRVAS